VRLERALKTRLLAARRGSAAGDDDR